MISGLERLNDTMHATAQARSLASEQRAVNIILKVELHQSVTSVYLLAFIKPFKVKRVLTIFRLMPPLVVTFSSIVKTILTYRESFELSY